MGERLCLQWIECSKNLSIIEILRVKIGRHIMKNCGEKKDLESKGKFDETSFSLDVKKLQWRVPYFNSGISTIELHRSL